MELSADRLAEHLARQPASPLYILWGTEPLTLLESEDAIRAAALQAGHSQRMVHTVQGKFDWSRVFAGNDNFSLFASKRLLEIRIPSGKPGVEGGKALERLAGSPPADTLTIVSLPGLEWKSTQSKWFSALAAVGVVIQARPVERAQLPAWISRRLAARRFTADADALNYLAERVEGNLLAARQEIDKLALLMPAGPLSLEAVQQAVTDVSRFEPEQLQDTLLRADWPRYNRILGSLRQEGEPPPVVLWQITAAIRLLLRLKWGLERREPLPRLLAAARVWEKRRPLVEAGLKRHGRKALEQALQTCALVDRQIKGAEQGDPWVSLAGISLILANA
ncbi:MAG: DNA polymerase III subunit delta [Thiobacillaceae bacterium]